MLHSNASARSPATSCPRGGCKSGAMPCNVLRMKAVLFSILLALGLSAPVSSGAVIFKDALDRTIVLEKEAERVAIVYNYVEYAAVAGDECFRRVVGIGKKAWFGWRKGIWDEYAKACPEIAQIEDIGLLRFGDFYLEKFLLLNPDILILPKWQFDAVDAGLMEKFKEAKVNLVVTDYANQALETHVKSTLAIGKAIGKNRRAKQIVDFYRSQLSLVTGKIGDALARPRVYIEKGQAGAGKVDDTWSKVVWGDMLETAGGKNIADGIIPAGKHGRMEMEQILKSNPRHVFITGSNWANSNDALIMGYGVERELANMRLKPFISRLGWKELEAVRKNQIHGIHHGLARTLMDFSAIQYMAKQLHGDLFRDIDPMRNLEEFHEKFLPVPLAGTWFFRLQIAE